MRLPEFAWNFLENIGKLYKEICKALRKKYRWTPEQIDSIALNRLLEIVNDLLDEAEKKEFEDELGDLE